MNLVSKISHFLFQGRERRLVSLLINTCTVRFTEKILVCNGHWPMILNGIMKFQTQNLHDVIILVCALTTKLLACSAVTVRTSRPSGLILPQVVQRHLQENNLDLSLSNSNRLSNT
jgi:hypothetical protein